jgi:hypothetical protein
MNTELQTSADVIHRERLTEHGELLSGLTRSLGNRH